MKKMSAKQKAFVRQYVSERADKKSARAEARHIFKRFEADFARVPLKDVAWVAGLTGQITRRKN